MSIEELLKIEPRLKYVIKFVKDKNYMAKHRETYWVAVWKEAKLRCNNLVGIHCDKPIISKSEHWDLFHNHLKRLATNCL